MSVFSDRASTGVVDGGFEQLKPCVTVWHGMGIFRKAFFFSSERAGQEKASPGIGGVRGHGTSPCFLEGGNRGLQSVAVPDLILCTLRTASSAGKAGLSSLELETSNMCILAYRGIMTAILYKLC